MFGYDGLIGKWRSSLPHDSDDYLCEYTIRGTETNPKVDAVDLQDNEPFDVTNIAWDGQTLSFNTSMPSTGRSGICRFRLAGSDRIESKFTFTVVEGLSRHGA